MVDESVGRQAVVPCGGEGARLRPLTYYYQKTMVPIGKEERPLLEYVVRLLIHHGFLDILLLTGYKANQIHNYFDDGSRFRANIRCVQDRRDLSGTGGALLNARDLLDEDFLVYDGDILSAINLSELWRNHVEANADCTLALARDYPVRVGVADLGPDSELRGFVEKPMLGRPVSIGICALNKNAISLAEEIAEQKLKRDRTRTPITLGLMGDILPCLVSKGRRAQGFLTDDFWYDVGSLERYEKLDSTTTDRELSFLK